VVVQYYNSLLALSKISSASHGVIIFENEIAQDICKTMKGIQRPRLSDINHVITSNIIPILLPKCCHYNPYHLTKSIISDDISYLCSHPGYRFLDIKITPQTYSNSIEYTFDSWYSLLHVIMKMQIRGTCLERGLWNLDYKTVIHNLRDYHSNIHDQKKSNRKLLSMPSTLDSCINLASILTLHGKDVDDVNITMDHLQYGHKNDNQNDILRYARDTKSFINSSTPNRIITDHKNISYEGYYSSLYPRPMELYHTHYQVNNYQRSLSILNNGTMIIPYLQRVINKSIELFQVQAYLHQYIECDLEQSDFITAYQNVGQIVTNYHHLQPS
jgi:hypothetical protein